MKWTYIAISIILLSCTRVFRESENENLPRRQYSYLSDTISLGIINIQKGSRYSLSYFYPIIIGMNATDTFSLFAKESDDKFSIGDRIIAYSDEWSKEDIDYVRPAYVVYKDSKLNKLFLIDTLYRCTIKLPATSRH